MKRLGLIVGGVSGFVCALGFGALLFQYIVRGSGLQILGKRLPFFGEPISSGSIAIGLVHVVGLATACFLCFAVGACLCAHGIVPLQKLRANGAPETERQPTQPASPPQRTG